MQDTSKVSQAQNVRGFERFASVAGGLVILAKGIRRGGLLGIAEFGIGAMVLARGANGQCALKRAMSEREDKDQRQKKVSDIERYSHMPMDSEVHSPDFESDAVTMPDTSQMGNEARADRHSTAKPGSDK